MSVKKHEGRLRKLLQFLKNKEAIIKVDHNTYGEAKPTTYSSGKDVEHSLKDLVLSIWVDDTDNVFYEYLKDFEVDTRKTVKKKHHPSHQKFILDITCTFKESSGIDREEEKEQLFFSGAHLDATNLHAAFPDFRNKIKNDIKQFSELLTTGDGFPYQKLRNFTSHRCHRYKQLEKDIFQYLKDADNSTLNEIRQNLAKVMSSYVEHLAKLENNDIGHQKPENREKVDNSLSFKELSIHDGGIEIGEDEEEKIQEIGFQEAFSVETDWFDSLRFKKLAYWIDTLDELPISAWPDYYLEQILLSYFELNSVCTNLVKIRNRIFQEVGYYVTYSQDGKEIVAMDKFRSHKELSVQLSEYEYVANDFVDALRSDGNLLVDPLRRLPEAFNEISSPDKQFHSRIQKIVWDYLLFRMCRSCQLSEHHVAGFDYSP